MITQYGFLKGKFGQEVLKKYNSLIKSEYNNNPNLDVLNFGNEVIEGSNIPSVVLMNKILSKYNLRTANPVDVQNIIENNENFLNETYVDFGLVLRSEEGTNEYFAKELAKQAKERKYEFSNSNPLVFKASDLELIVDNNSPLGLGFNIKDSATPFNASELSYDYEEKRFNKTNEKGMPIFDEEGKRILFTNEDGLSRLYLTWSLNLGSKYDKIAGSYDMGRIVVMNN